MRLAINGLGKIGKIHDRPLPVVEVDYFELWFPSIDVDFLDAPKSDHELIAYLPRENKVTRKRNRHLVDYAIKLIVKRTHHLTDIAFVSVFLLNTNLPKKTIGYTKYPITTTDNIIYQSANGQSQTFGLQFSLLEREFP